MAKAKVFPFLIDHGPKEKLSILLLAHTVLPVHLSTIGACASQTGNASQVAFSTHTHFLLPIRHKTRPCCFGGPKAGEIQPYRQELKAED